jgi:hypothetical protein
MIQRLSWIGVVVVGMLIVDSVQALSDQDPGKTRETGSSTQPSGAVATRPATTQKATELSRGESKPARDGRNQNQPLVLKNTIIFPFCKSDSLIGNFCR